MMAIFAKDLKIGIYITILIIYLWELVSDENGSDSIDDSLDDSIT